MEEEVVPIRMENNNVNKRKIWPIICIVLAILLIAGGGYYYYTNYYSKNDTKEETTRPSLKDDFYEYVNYQNTESPMQDPQSVVFQQQGLIISQIEKDPTFKNENYFTFFDLYEDEDERNKKGIDDLKPYFEEIDNADTLDKFSDIMIKVSYDLGVDSFINFSIEPNAYDNSKNVISINPMVLEKLSLFNIIDPMSPSGLEFFTNEKYSKYKEAFEKARVEYFKQYGYDEAKSKKLSNEITDFAKTIQAKSQSIDNLQNNPLDYYKIVTKSELKSLISNLPLDKFLAKYNLSSYPYFAITDQGHLEELNKYYKEENLPLMKEILKLLILEDVASLYSSADYARILSGTFYSLNSNLLNYQQAWSVYESYILKPDMMGSILNKTYEQIYFTEAEKQEMRDLINKIKNQYKVEINNSDWLDDSTKTEAIKKIDNMKVYVGSTDKNEKPSNAKLLSKENGGSLLSNYILLEQEKSKELATTIKEVKKAGLSQFFVNAFYDPQDNSINMLTGYREVYRNIEDKYAKYAYVGAVIGHEMSHAFDSTGSQFDEKGNVKKWWSENDQNDYSTRKQKIADYYSKFDVYGIKINGELTVSENIADLGSVKTILSIMASENATNDDYKTFFESYAKLWNTTATKEDIEAVMISDNHSPNKIRVNAVLSSMDKFYEVYDIKEGDKMYVAKENRVGLW